MLLSITLRALASLKFSVLSLSSSLDNSRNKAAISEDKNKHFKKNAERCCFLGLRCNDNKKPWSTREQEAHGDTLSHAQQKPSLNNWSFPKYCCTQQKINGLTHFSHQQFIGGILRYCIIWWCLFALCFCQTLLPLNFPAVTGRWCVLFSLWDTGILYYFKMCMAYYTWTNIYAGTRFSLEKCTC